jgi:hypothetical protein
VLSKPYESTAFIAPPAQQSIAAPQAIMNTPVISETPVVAASRRVVNGGRPAGRGHGALAAAIQADTGWKEA